jgi:DNA-binding HxlR family transcriptional regulator
MRKKKYHCPAEMTLDIIAGKWKIILIWHLRKNPKRFGELRRLTPGITQMMLTQQLRSLESQGIVQRREIQSTTKVPGVEYSLTELGQSLKPILYSLVKWGRENQSKFVIGEYRLAFPQSV